MCNGALVTKAEAAGFDVLLTADKNLSYQPTSKTSALARSPSWCCRRTAGLIC
jgi:hypothetical protein